MSKLEETSSGSDNFSHYGVYKITDSEKIILPNVEVRISKIGNNVFLYERRDSAGDVIEKMIPTSSDAIDVEISPIRPLNYPARRTTYVYLDLETPVFLSEGSTAKIFARCPIEIGVFLVHDGHKDSLDWFACDTYNSRFGLYGTPDSGTLCKYTKSEIVESYDDSIPFVNAVLEINLKNDLNYGHSISKIVFPISEYSVYYKDSRAIIDSVYAILKKKITLDILDVSPKPIQTDWTLAPTYERDVVIKRMDVGVD